MSRGTVSGNGIVTDGLVLSLDAANTRSYVSGSTTWRDLSANNYTGSLINGSTFNSANGGNIVFDGVDDYFEITNNGLRTGINISHSLEMWVNFTTLVGTRWWLAIIGQQNSGALAWIGRSATDTQFGVWLGNQLSPNLIGTNQWLHLVMTFNGTNIIMYVNSVFQGSTSASFNFINTNFSIALRGRSDEAYFNGKVAIAKIYNRALSAAEVLQNYNATKTRFGL